MWAAWAPGLVWVSVRGPMSLQPEGRSLMGPPGQGCEPWGGMWPVEWLPGGAAGGESHPLSWKAVRTLGPVQGLAHWRPGALPEGS